MGGWMCVFKDGGVTKRKRKRVLIDRANSRYTIRLALSNMISLSTLASLVAWH